MRRRRPSQKCGNGKRKNKKNGNFSENWPIFFSLLSNPFQKHFRVLLTKTRKLCQKAENKTNINHRFNENLFFMQQNYFRKISVFFFVFPLSVSAFREGQRRMSLREKSKKKLQFTYLLSLKSNTIRLFN